MFSIDCIAMDSDIISIIWQHFLQVPCIKTFLKISQRLSIFLKHICKKSIEYVKFFFIRANIWQNFPAQKTKLFVITITYTLHFCDPKAFLALNNSFKFQIQLNIIVRPTIAQPSTITHSTYTNKQKSWLLLIPQLDGWLFIGDTNW